MRRHRTGQGARFIAVFWLALVASGCANLGAIRDFASTSSDAAQYNQLVGAYVATPTRMMRYEPEPQRPVLAGSAGIAFSHERHCRSSSARCSRSPDAASVSGVGAGRGRAPSATGSSYAC